MHSFTPAQYALLRTLYRLLCGAVPVLAELLGEPSPLRTREERRGIGERINS